MLKSALIVFANVIVVANQLERAQQQLGEVDHAIALADIFVEPVNLEHLLLDRILPRIDMRRSQAFILVVIDIPLRLFRRPARLVQVELANDTFDYA